MSISDSHILNFYTEPRSFLLVKTGATLLSILKIRFAAAQYILHTQKQLLRLENNALDSGLLQAGETVGKGQKNNLPCTSCSSRVLKRCKLSLTILFVVLKVLLG